MFGMNRKPRGLFGGGLPGPIGGFGGGTWNVDGTQAMPVERHGYAQSGEAPQRKAGFFGQGGPGRAIAGTIGDVLLQRGGMQPIYAPTMQNKQKALLAEQDAQRERGDWVWKKEWERDNLPRETAPYRTEDNAGNVWEMGADGQFKPIFVDPNDKQFIQDGQLVTVPNRVRSQREASAGPRVGAIVNGHRFKGGDPNDPVSWEAVGGAAAPASPPFGGSLDPLKGPGTVTSMRRTPEGNRIVGGVANSRHLTGEAVDVVGATPAQLRAYYGPDAKIGWHKNHHHIVKPGAQFPHYGKRGTKGLKR